MANQGAFGAPRSRASRRGGGSIGSGNIDANPPRIASLRTIRYEKKLAGELYGETAKKARANVSLPKFSWEKE